MKLVHQALPELATAAIDTSVNLLGKRLRAPLVIASMTGGVERAEAINRELASIADARGYGFGLGSQRAMHLNAATGRTYRVRDVAPAALVLRNPGSSRPSDDLPKSRLRPTWELDALCIHLNPAMEDRATGRGDRDFTGAGYAAKAHCRLDLPIVAKETGCGLVGTGGRNAEGSWRATSTSREPGGLRGWRSRCTVRGAKKETSPASFRSRSTQSASVAWMARAGFETVIATGGVATGVDVAKAIALGATAAGIARPILQALTSGGRAAAERFLDGVEAELRAAMLLVGAGSLAALRSAPRIVVGELSFWLEQGSVDL